MQPPAAVAAATRRVPAGPVHRGSNTGQRPGRRRHAQPTRGNQVAAQILMQAEPDPVTAGDGWSAAQPGRRTQAVGPVSSRRNAAWDGERQRTCRRISGWHIQNRDVPAHRIEVTRFLPKRGQRRDIRSGRMAPNCRAFHYCRWLHQASDDRARPSASVAMRP